MYKIDMRGGGSEDRSLEKDLKDTDRRMEEDLLVTSSHLTRNHTERREEDLLVIYPRLTEDHTQRTALNS